MEQNWASLRLGEVTIQTKEGQHIFDIKVNLNGLDQNAVQVELYAEGIDG